MVVSDVFVVIDGEEQAWGEYRFKSMPVMGDWIALKRGEIVHDLLIDRVAYIPKTRLYATSRFTR